MSKEILSTYLLSLKLPKPKLYFPFIKIANMTSVRAQLLDQSPIYVLCNK